MKGLHYPTKAFLIQKRLTSLSRQESCDVRLPISKPILHDLVSSLQRTNSSAAQRILFSAMFLTAFYGFFRIGELAARSACHTTLISYDNIRFLASGGKIHSIKITITHFKHNTSNCSFTLLFPVMNLHHFVLLSSYSGIAISGVTSPGPSSAMQTIHPLRLTNLIPNLGAA